MLHVCLGDDDGLRPERVDLRSHADAASSSDAASEGSVEGQMI